MARAPKVEMSIDGLTEAKEALALLPEEFRFQAAVTIDVGTAIIEGEADARVPVREGVLKRSIGRSVRADGLQATVGSSDPKARWVEFATIHTPAQPFLWPAFRVGARYIRKEMRTWAAEAGKKVRLRTKRLKRPKAAP